MEFGSPEPTSVHISLALIILAIEGISGRSLSPLFIVAPLEDDDAKDFVSSKLTFSMLLTFSATLFKVFHQFIK